MPSNPDRLGGGYSLPADAGPVEDQGPGARASDGPDVLGGHSADTAEQRTQRVRGE
jgi:hypothetical protein